MKDSGVEWIGEIPEGWELIKLKWLLDVPLQYGANESGDEFNDSLPRYIRITDIYANGKLKDDNKLSLSLDKAKDFLLNDGDILFARSGASVGKSFIFRDIYGTSAFAGYLIRAIVNKNKILPELLYYNTLSTSYEKWKDIIFIQSTIQNIGAEKYSHMKLVLPPMNEQFKIVSYIDKKCSAIDTSIQKEHEIIDKLKEYRQSVITEAVTKGINKNVKMKDSGVEWIGVIPEGWDVKRLKLFFKFGKGLPITKENLVDNGVSVISYGQIHSKLNTGVCLDSSLIRFVNEEYLKTNSDSLVNKYDFIFADTSEDLDGCGNCVYVNDDVELFAGYHTIILKSIYSIDNKYLAYLFKSDIWRSQIRLNVSGVKLFSITKGILNKVTVIIPILSEQNHIASYLDKKCSDIDTVISEKQKLIDKLEEYKKSLIYEYVTGKKVIDKGNN